MPGKVKVKIIAGRNLPVMDRSSDTTDAYVEIKLGNTTYKTDVCRKSLNPQWNSEWYRFEVDDSELQDEPLQLRLMDHDTYSANDAIGKVYLDLNPLLLPAPSTNGKSLWSEMSVSTSTNTAGSVMSGWIPVYDTMHGIRGEVHVIVKVELFSDFNRFRQSSCGVLFLCTPAIPQGYHAQVIHGFVEELVVNDDPEYQWIDKIRTPRASNEARQTLFFKLSGEVQRKIGLKALDLGGNAVIGYHQCFDLEGESGIVARGIGTAVSLVRVHEGLLGHGSVNTSAHDETALVVLSGVPSSPRLCIIPPTPTTSTNPSTPLTLQNKEDKKSLPLIGPRFPQSRPKAGKRRPVVVVPGADKQKSMTHRRQCSAPFDLAHQTPYKRQNSTKSLVTDLSDLQHLLEQEDMRQGAGLPGRNRFMKAIRHIPRKVNALRGRLYSDDSDLDNVSCSSTKSLSLDFRRKATKQSSNDSIAAALIRSIMMDSGSGSMDRGGLTRVVEGEETTLSAPATPKSKFFSSSGIELDRANELLHQISSDAVDSLAFVESSNASSSCDSSTSEDDMSDSSAIEPKNDDSILADEDDSLDNSSISVTSGSPAADIVTPSGKGVSKSKVKFLIGTNEALRINERRKKSRSLSPKGRVTETKRKGYSSSPKIFTTKCHVSKMKNEALSQSASSLAHVTRHTYSDGSMKTDLSTSSQSSKGSEVNTSSKSPECDRRNSKTTSSPFDREFSAAAVALKTSPTVVKAEHLPQPFEPADLPVDSISHYLQSSSPEKAVVGDVPKSFASAFGHGASASFGGTHQTVANKTNTHHQYTPETSVEPMSKPNFNKQDPNLPLYRRPTAIDSSINIESNLEEDAQQRPEGEPCQTNMSMTKSSESSFKREAEVSDNPLCSLTLDTPRVLSPLYKSRSTASLACRHEAATAPNSAAEVEREQREPPEEDKVASPGPGCKQSQSQSPAKLNAAPPSLHRRSSDSDLSVTPKGNSLTGSDRSSCAGGHHSRHQMTVLQPPVMNQDNLDMLEYPFLTMSKFPPGFIQSIGGTVSSRSVKLLERITNLEEPETRDTWWKELRMEVRSHARALGCNVVLGYSEHTSICDDVCVLSAAGTAAVINLQYNPTELDVSGSATGVEKHQYVLPDQPSVETIDLQQQLSTPAQTFGIQLQKQSGVRSSHDRVTTTTSLDRSDFEKDRVSSAKTDISSNRSDSKARHSSEGTEVEIQPGCYMCHIPYSESSVPFRVKMLKCSMCRKGKVPDVLITTMEPPEGIPVTGCGCLVQAYVCRPKRDTKGELNAKEISDSLPFLEYELHRMLLNKLKVKGMNAVFGLKVQVSIGERMLVGLATGTAMFLTPLPSPPVPSITAGNSWSDERRLLEVQRTLAETARRNRELYHLKPHSDFDTTSSANGRCNPSDTEDSEDDLPDLDLAVGNKDACVLEVDDNEDVDIISLLMDPYPPEGFHVVNTETVPGLEEMDVVRNLQMFTQVWRAKVAPSMPPTVFSKHFHRMLQSVYFKLRRMVPCALAELRFFVDLPEPDELQLSLLGMALGLGELEKTSKFKKKSFQPSTSKEQFKKDEHDLIFNLEDDVVLEESTGAAAISAAASAPNANKPIFKGPYHISSCNQRPRIIAPRHTPPRERYGVDITPLSYIPGGKIDRYLGNLNFFFIRESNSIRESGGLSGFVHSFIAEVLAIVRAHVTALGGNAMVSYFISENVLLHNPHKNQGQCLINVGGDVVHVSYYSDEF